MGIDHDVKVCDITTIEANETTVEPNPHVGVLQIGGNKNVSFLSVELAVSFPPLKNCESYNCSITIVSYANFRGLAELEDLSLSSNQIETIASDMFKDLTSLEKLDLGKRLDSKPFLTETLTINSIF